MDESRIVELNRWREEAATALDAAKKMLGEVQRTIKQNEQRLQLVDDLLAIEGATFPSVRSARESDNLLDICENIMMSNARALHISELHNELLSRGVAIPGRGTEANLIVRLQRSDGRFVRVGRGMYAPQKMMIPEAKPVRIRRAAQSRGSGRK